MNRHSALVPAAVLLFCLSAGSACAQLSTKALAGWSGTVRNPLPPFDDWYYENHQTNTGADSATISRTSNRTVEIPPFGQLATYMAFRGNCHAASAYGTLTVDTNVEDYLGPYAAHESGDAAASASYRDQFTVTAGNGPLELVADIEATWNTARPAQRSASDSFGNPLPPGIFPGPLTSTWFYCYANGATAPAAGRLWRGDQLWYEDPPNPSGFYRFSVSLGSFTSGVSFEATLLAHTGSSGRTNGIYSNSVQLQVTGYRVRNTATGADVPLISLATASGFAPVSSGPPSLPFESTLQGGGLTARFQPGKQLNQSAVIEASTDLLTWQIVDAQWDGLWLTHQEPVTAARRFFRATLTPYSPLTQGFRWIP